VTYPYAAFPENLAAFCVVLRHEYGFRSGPRELIDAARALELISLADVPALRHTLRPILSCTADDARVFDDAFDRFFLRRGAPHLESPPLPGAQTREIAGTASRRRGPGHSEQYGWPMPAARARDEDAAASVVGVADDDEREGAEETLRASYSPLEGEGAAPDLLPPDRAWRDGAAALVERLHAGLSRRWLPAHHGERFDMRRTLRGSLHTGGEMVIPHWRARPHRRPKFVVLVDGSRSMGARATPPLQIAVALASVTMNVEAFTFSTEIGRITRAVRRAASGRPQPLHHLHHAWGGGTTIGACLREFLRLFGERLLGREVVLVIASDGLDVGAPDTLRDVMARLRRLSAGIAWLNPLVETPGYEPTALGMRAALPHVTTFTWIEDAAGLLKLSRTIRLRNQ
jgi:uncharacterized protein